MDEQVINVSLDKIRSHPLNATIYGEQEDVSDLVSSIRVDGKINTPIILTSDYVIVSGHRRVQAAKVAGFTDIPAIIRSYASEDDIVVALVESNKQREKTVSQRQRELSILKEKLGKRSSKEKRPGEAQDDLLAQIAGLSKGQQHREHMVYQTATRDKDPYAQKLLTQLDNGEISLQLAYKRVTEHVKNERIKEERKKAAEKGYSIEDDRRFQHGDFATVLDIIPDGSVDAIITDPPYPFKFIEEWRRLAVFASRKLRPGGWLVAYSGQLHLPEVLLRLQHPELRYYWTMCLSHAGGGTQLINDVNMTCMWKPILVFQKASSKEEVLKLEETCSDQVDSLAREKGIHVWQQSESGVARLIETFTKPGDTIVDPFAGSGTTLYVANKLDRKWYGAELDEEEYLKAKVRLSSL